MKKVGAFLEHMDKGYHHHRHRPGGWIFCDLLDYYYGMPARSLLEERHKHSNLLYAAILLVPMGLIRASSARYKWNVVRAPVLTPGRLTAQVVSFYGDNEGW